MKILDCTLRDGGYYTNWDFDKDMVEEYCKAMESLQIDYVEIGYRSNSQKGYLGEYFYCPEYLMKRLKELMPSKKLTIILNEKDVNLDDINRLLLSCKPYISLVRMAIAPDNFERAIPKAIEVKKMGFEVGFNVMYMSSWVDNKAFLDSLSQIDGLIDYFYMVDSYGGVMPEDVKELCKIVKEKTTVPIGFHGHDNLEMALINSINAIDSGCGIIDSTITGMGRGAGNLKTELLLTYLSAKKGVELDLNEISSTVASFESLQNKFKWGTNLPYMVSGAYSLPQKDVMDWIGKKRYSISGIVNALRQSDSKNKQYSLPDLSIEKKEGNNILIIGGGTSVVKHYEALEKFLINNPEIIVIHAGTRNVKLFDHLDNKQFFCLVGNEGYRLKKVFGDFKVFKHKIVLPLDRKMGTYIPEEILKFSYQLSEKTRFDKHDDSPLSVSIDLSLILKPERVYLAGFDGYSDELNSTQYSLTVENQYIFDTISNIDVNIISLTPTKYNIGRESVYGYIK